MDIIKIEDQLLGLKQRIEDTQKEIERNEGRLGGLYDNLISVLDLPKKTNRKKVITDTNKKIKSLKTQINKEEKELESLMQNIQNEMEDWDD